MRTQTRLSDRWLGAVEVLVDKSSAKICTGMDTGDSVPVNCDFFFWPKPCEFYDCKASELSSDYLSASHYESISTQTCPGFSSGGEPGYYLQTEEVLP